MKPATGLEIDLGDDAELVALLEEREELYRRVRADHHRLGEIKAAIVPRLGKPPTGGWRTGRCSGPRACIANA